MKGLFFWICIYLLSNSLFAQNSEWLSYRNDQTIHSLVIGENYIRPGTDSGLVKLNKTTGMPISYNTFNSGYNTTLIDSYVNGDVYAIEIKDNVAFCGNGKYLETIDLSNLDHPVYLGKITFPYNIKKITVSGDYAYIITVDEEEISIIDISDPSNCKLVSSIYSEGYVKAISIKGNYAYVAGYEYLTIFDITNPQTPVIIKHFTPFSGNVWSFNITINGNYAYMLSVLENGKSLDIIDISDLNKLQIIGQLNIQDSSPYAKEIVAKGNYVYIAANANGLRVINVSDPTEPIETDNFETGWGAYSLALNGNYIYVASVLGGLDIIDISDPSNPVYHDPSFFSLMNGRAVAAKGNYCVVNDAVVGLNFLDISNPVNPIITSTLENDGLDISLNGNYVYTIGTIGGLNAFDISNPSNIIHSDYYSYPGLDIKVRSNYAYVTKQWGGLIICDISDPDNIIEVGETVNEYNYYSDVALKGNNAYVTDFDERLLRIIDVSNPQYLTQISQLKFNTGIPSNIIIDKNYAYIAADSAGFYVVDISNPFSPKEITLFKTEKALNFSPDWSKDNITGLSLKNNYLYLSYWIGGLSIINISDPSNPYLVSNFTNSCLIRDVKVDGSYAYVIGQDSVANPPNYGFDNWNLYIVDIFNPYHPIETGHFVGERTNEFDSSERAVEVKDNYAYIAGYAGLYIIQNDLLSTNRITNLPTPDSVLGNLYNRPYINYDVGRNIFDYYGHNTLQNWDILTSRNDKINYLNQTLPLEFKLRQEQSYNGDAWTQAQLNTYGISNITGYIDNQKSELNVVYDSTLNAFFNIPILQVTAYDDNEVTFNGNGILVGDSLLNYKSWYFYDPADSNKEIDLSNHAYISLGLLAYVDSPNQNEYMFLNDMIKLGLKNGKQIDTVNYNIFIRRHNPFTAQLELIPPKDTTIAYIDSIDILGGDFGIPEISSNLKLGQDLNFWGKNEYSQNHYEGWVNANIERTIIDTIFTGSDKNSFTVKGKTVVTLVEKNALFNSENPDGKFYEYVLKKKSVSWNVEANYITSVKDTVNGLPKYFAVSQNYPNPFNPTTTIEYSVPHSSNVKLGVFNTLGQQVTSLVNKIQQPGNYKVEFDGSNLSSGIYFYRIEAGDFVETKKLILLK